MSYVVRVLESDAISNLPLYLYITKLNSVLLTYRPSDAHVFITEDKAIDTFRQYVEHNYAYYIDISVSLDACVLWRTFI
jgi:hypothetical protein